MMRQTLLHAAGRAMVFPSKIDSWLLMLIAMTVLVSLGAAVATLDASSLLAAAIAVLLGALFPLWLFASTDYRVSDGECLVRSGPFRWRIPLDDIEAVRATRNPLSSPALSLDRLEIRYAGGRKIMISPRDRAGFLAAIGWPSA